MYERIEVQELCFRAWQMVVLGVYAIFLVVVTPDSVPPVRGRYPASPCVDVLLRYI